MIRDSINRKYDLIHYIYTTFYESTQTGLPLMRPMFIHYPDISALWGHSEEFMFGDSMLVVPKLKAPTSDLEKQKKQEVTYMLPSGDLWYNYYSKQTEETKTQWVTRTLPDLEQAVYIKGGSVLPILEHEGCMALTKCINNGIRLEVYLDTDNYA